MEQNFQTSFIPKKPIIEERAKPSRPISFFMVIAIFVFITMVLSVGGVYFYKQVLVKDIANMENNLSLAKNRFEPAKINQLQVLDKRLKSSTEVLAQHISVSPIFEALQEITMKSVRYTRFSYELGPTKDSYITVKLGGMATGYRAIALQSDLFLKNKYLIDPVFSNLSLDEKGNVLFDLEFLVEPSFVDYKQTLQRNTAEDDNAPSTSNASNTVSSFEDLVNQSAGATTNNSANTNSNTKQ